MIFFIDSKQLIAAEMIAEYLKRCIRQIRFAWSEVVFLCIGTDRSTGDCLGPYVGRQLDAYVKTIPGVHVYGTLEKPVHALNLPDISEQIAKMHPNALVIAVDASLGEKNHLGYVSIGNGALLPGAGVRRKLPSVGNLFITGIVNTAGFLEYLTLQTTPLSTVVTLAETITRGIEIVIADEFDHHAKVCSVSCE